MKLFFHRITSREPQETKRVSVNKWTFGLYLLSGYFVTLRSLLYSQGTSIKGYSKTYDVIKARGRLIFN